VVSDQIVRLGKCDRFDHPLRVVIVQCPPHEKRSNRKGNTGAGPSDGFLRIATDLLDPPAQIIALIYRHRYQIELFFRFFKQLLGCHHLISDKPEGIQIQVYCAIILCLLLSVWTGRKPTKATLEMFYFYIIDLATEEELAAHLNSLNSPTF
jgi:hypothetical protein